MFILTPISTKFNSKFPLKVLNLTSKYRPIWHPVDKKIVAYIWDFPNQNSMQRNFCYTRQYLDKVKYLLQRYLRPTKSFKSMLTNFCVLRFEIIFQLAVG